MTLPLDVAERSFWKRMNETSRVGYASLCAQIAENATRLRARSDAALPCVRHAIDTAQFGVGLDAAAELQQEARRRRVRIVEDVVRVDGEVVRDESAHRGCRSTASWRNFAASLRPKRQDAVRIRPHRPSSAQVREKPASFHLTRRGARARCSAALRPSADSE